MSLLTNPEETTVQKVLVAPAPLDAKIVVADIPTRDAIPAIQRYHMMKVATQDTGKEYRLASALDLTNTGWTEVVVSGIGEAPIDGFPYVRKDAGWLVVGSVIGPTVEDKNLTPAVTAGDGSTTAITLSNTPTGYAGVYINGLLANLTGDKLGDCYFSGDAGVSARALGLALITDTLFWNGVIAGYDLAVADRIDLLYS